MKRTPTLRFGLALAGLSLVAGIACAADGPAQDGGDGPPPPPPGASGPEEGGGHGGHPGRGGRPPGPPPEAIAACKGKTEGAAASFTGRNGETFSGTCQYLGKRDDRREDKGGGKSDGKDKGSDKVLALRPNGPPPPPPGQPPQPPQR